VGGGTCCLNSKRNEGVSKRAGCGKLIPAYAYCGDAVAMD